MELWHGNDIYLRERKSNKNQLLSYIFTFFFLQSNAPLERTFIVTTVRHAQKECFRIKQVKLVANRVLQERPLLKDLGTVDVSCVYLLTKQGNPKRILKQNTCCLLCS